MWVSGGGLPLPRAPARFASCLLHGHERTLWNAISRKLPRHPSRQLDLCTHRTPMVESPGSLEFQPRCLKSKLIAISRMDS